MSLSRVEGIKKPGNRELEFYNFDHVIETYDGSSKPDEFRVFVDVDFAGCPTTTKSTSGIMVMINGIAT